MTAQNQLWYCIDSPFELLQSDWQQTIPAEMTELLQQAFKHASKLPPAEQDAFAQFMLEELRAERQWDETLADSVDALQKFAADARAAVARGEDEPLNLERM